MVCKDPETASLYDNLHCEDLEASNKKISDQCLKQIANEVRIPIDESCGSTTDVPRFPKIFVEGPTGSAMEDVFKFKVALCFAGGIGVTPFACVLNTLR